MWRKMGIVAGVVVALAGVTFLAPRLLQTVNTGHLNTLQSMTDTIWWPATLARVGVYAVLGWLVYPAWIDGHRRQVHDTLATLPGDRAETAASRAQLAARLAVLASARTRGHWIFLSLVGSDLLIAQLPYYLTQH